MVRPGAFLFVLLACAACLPPEVSDLPAKPEGTSNQGRHHPAGFAAASAHGLAAKLVEEDCRSCHGPDLEGTPASANVSCSSCHMPQWKESCTFCHGGRNDSTGAPPRDITNVEEPALLTFRAHTKHVSATTMASAMDCTQCHAKPANALDEGHWFDSTPIEAEVTFAGGLAATGVYDGAGGCSNLYCHGDGRAANGTVSHTEGSMACSSCHPSLETPARWGAMSGDHSLHLQLANVTCVDCHSGVVGADSQVAVPAEHVDGTRDVLFEVATISWNATTRRCEGACHGQNHGDAW